MDYTRYGVTFNYLARSIMLGRGRIADTQSIAEHQLRSPSDTILILRAAVDIGSIGNSTWGSQVAGYGHAVAGFISSIAHLSVFDRMLAGGIRRIPLRGRVVASAYATPPQGYIVGEGALKPISRLALAGLSGEPQKGACIIVLAKELVENQAPGSAEFFANELRQAVVAVTDSEFLQRILAPAPHIEAGSSGGNVLDDVARLLDLVTIGANSRLYLVTTPQVAKWLSTRTDDSGMRQYPEMTPLGGTLAGIPVLVTDQVDGGTDGEAMALIDATAIAGTDDTMTLSSAEHATLELDNDPQGDASSVQTSLWQENLLGLKVERYFRAEKLRDTGFAVLTGIDYSDHS